MTVICNRSCRWILPAILATTFAGLLGQPRLKSDTPQGYQVGDRLDQNTFLLDREMRRHPLQQILRDDAQVVVLVIFGGAGKQAPKGESMRGGIWCADSFDDFPLQRALINQFSERGVQFIGVAVPPVYSDSFGFAKDVFLKYPDSDKHYRKAAKAFIARTERLREQNIIPFQTIYYDPKFRLAQNKKQRTLDPEAFGEILPWQGLLKWPEDARRYGTPTIWILDSKGVILRQPFFGNEYDRQPPELSYSFADIKQVIEELLER